MTSVMVLNGPNLARLGSREPEIYGTASYEDLVTLCQDNARRLGMQVDVRQSDDEAELIRWIHEAIDADQPIVINPAAFTHTSVALRDALLAVEIPFIEIHLSNVHAREAFRKHSFLSDVAVGSIVGLGPQGYELALEAALARVASAH